MNIDRIIQKFGMSVHIENQEGWVSPTFNTFIQPLRYKNKLYMTGDVTPIGKNTQDVYLYIGPREHDLTKFNFFYRIYDADNNSYIIDRAEKVTFKNEVVYIWAIIRKTTEDKA